MATASASTGVGLRGIREPAGPLDCGNAGTLMRLLPGILAGQAGRFELVGDESLSSRPMERIAEPLRAMGARVETTDGRAPVVVEGGTLRAAPLGASRRERPGEVLRPPGRALRGGGADRGRRAVPEPRPHRADAGGDGSPRARRAEGGRRLAG